ncbi:hypothetical protein ACFWAP_10475 [Streptomyces goshikiensis]|uniref:hypothetical protein n=1 Tax=Streptomyces goshikiensis TaxID=1942 RepID=UPI003657FAD1
MKRAWLGKRGVPSLHQVDTQIREAYLAHRRYVRDEHGTVVGGNSPGTRRASAQVAVDLVSYSELFGVDRVPADLRPWGGATASAVAEKPSGRTENKTQPVQDQISQPLLAAALYLVSTLGPHSVALAGEAQQASVDQQLEPTAVLAPRTQRSDRDVLNLLTQRAKTPHIGPANFCWFTDPSRALCLKLAGTPTADRPLVGMSDSARCPQATHHPCHRLIRAERAERTKTFLGDLGKTRKTGHARLRNDYDRAVRDPARRQLRHQDPRPRGRRRPHRVLRNPSLCHLREELEGVVHLRQTAAAASRVTRLPTARSTSIGSPADSRTRPTCLSRPGKKRHPEVRRK